MKIIVCTRRIRSVDFGTRILYESDVIIETNDGDCMTYQVVNEVPSGKMEPEHAYQRHGAILRKAMDNAAL